MFSGGSAFGLDAASGVMRYLEERKIGFPFGGAYVPIVPGAVLFDLPVGGKPLIRPDASCGYAAAKAATERADRRRQRRRGRGRDGRQVRRQRRLAR